MGILDLFVRFPLLLYRHRVFLTVLFRDIGTGGRLRLVGYSRGIGTQISDDTRGVVSFDLHTLIELLRQAHRLLGREIQHLARLLLQRGGREGKRRFLDPLACLYGTHPVSRAGQFFLNLLHLLCGRNRAFLRLRAVIFRGQGISLPLHLQLRIQRPVFLRDKGIDFLLPVADNPKRHRLYTPRGQSTLHLGPQNR